MGEFAALKVKRGTDDEHVEIWFAAERGLIPLRVLVSEKDGTKYDQVAVKITAQ
jgi:hypothetical protein